MNVQISTAWVRCAGSPSTTRPSPTSTTRDRKIRRLACLNAAATFCGHYSTVHEEVRSNDVLKIAEAFERWVLEPEPGVPEC